MAERTRFQKGSLQRVARRSGPDCWVFRWWDEDASGKRVRRKSMIGSVEQYPTEASAQKAATALRMTINESKPAISGQQQIGTVGSLIEHYIRTELVDAGDDGKAYATRRVYKDFLRVWIEPRWGSYRLRDVRTIAVEQWLRGLTRQNRQPLASSTKAKIRNLMSALYNHAIRYEFLDQGKNPIKLVRQSAKRERIPDTLDAEELQALFAELGHRDRVMVLLDAVTGLRRSELIGLKWEDINFETLEISVTRSVYCQVVGRCKTETSRKPVPLDPMVGEELIEWRRGAAYNQPGDWVFGSPRLKGKWPYSPDMILARGIRPAAERAGIRKRIGWHTFRHSFSSMLRSNGEDIKVVQELLRHANSRITLDIYTQAVSPAKREAQSRVTRMIWTGGLKGSEESDPNGPSKEGQKGACAGVGGLNGP